jgi:hypothetical protein
MAAATLPGTLPGGLTPVCNGCGVALCWDISVEDYEGAKPFWDAWVCATCNGGEPLSLRSWNDGTATTRQPAA